MIDASSYGVVRRRLVEASERALDGRRRKVQLIGKRAHRPLSVGRVAQEAQQRQKVARLHGGERIAYRYTIQVMWRVFHQPRSYRTAASERHVVVGSECRDRRLTPNLLKQVLRGLWHGASTGKVRVPYLGV